MRLPLISLLMIPLTLSCGSKDDAADDAADEGAVGPLSGTEVFGSPVSVCDGERLESAPGGFVCTEVAMPAEAAYGLLEAPDSPGVIVPLLEQDGKWVTIAPLVADRQGAWSGAATYSIYDKAGTALASVEGVIAASAEPVTDAASELESWRSALESAWAELPGTTGRDVGHRLGLLTGLFQESLTRTYSPLLISGIPAEMDATAGEAVARALQQHRAELGAAGMDTEWSAMDAAHLRGTMALLPSAAASDAAQNIVFCGPATLGLALIAKVAIDGTIAVIIIDAAVDKITSGVDTTARSLCPDSLPLWGTTSKGAYQCVELNPDEPLAAELDELLPGIDELDSLTEDDLTHVAEGYYPDECCDSVDNDGNGETDECCVVLRSCEYVSIMTEADLEDAQSCQTANELDMDGAGISQIVLPHLEEVSESLTLGFSDSVRTFAAPSLKAVGEAQIGFNSVLTTVELPALESSFQFSLIANDVLTAVDLSALEVVDNSFTVTSNDSLSTLELPALASVGFGVPFGTIGYGVEIQFNSSLTLIQSPNLSVVDVDLDPAPGYPAIWTQVNASGCVHESPVCDVPDCTCGPSAR